MEKRGKQIMIGGTAGALIAGIVGVLEIQGALVWSEPHQQQHDHEKIILASRADKQQIQIINVQIIQIEIQLEAVTRRETTGDPIEGDGTRKERLIRKLIRLEAAKEELERK